MEKIKYSESKEEEWTNDLRRLLEMDLFEGKSIDDHLPKTGVKEVESEMNLNNGIQSCPINYEETSAISMKKETRGGLNDIEYEDTSSTENYKYLPKNDSKFFYMDFDPTLDKEMIESKASRANNNISINKSKGTDNSETHRNTILSPKSGESKSSGKQCSKKKTDNKVPTSFKTYNPKLLDEIAIPKKRISEEVEKLEWACQEKLKNTSEEFEKERSSWMLCLERYQDEMKRINEFYENNFLKLRSSLESLESKIESKYDGVIYENRNLIDHLVNEEREKHSSHLEQVQSLYHQQINILTHNFIKRSEQKDNQHEEGLLQQLLKMTKIIDKKVESLEVNWRKESDRMRQEISIQQRSCDGALNLSQRCFEISTNSFKEAEKMRIETSKIIDQINSLHHCSIKTEASVKQVEPQIYSLTQSINNLYKEFQQFDLDLKFSIGRIHSGQEINKECLETLITKLDTEINERERLVKIKESNLKSIEEGKRISQINQANYTQSNSRNHSKRRTTIKRHHADLQEKEKALKNKLDKLSNLEQEIRAKELQLMHEQSKINKKLSENDTSALSTKVYKQGSLKEQTLPTTSVEHMTIPFLSEYILAEQNYKSMNWKN